MDEHSWVSVAMVCDTDFLLLDFLKGCSPEELAEIMQIRNVA